MNYPQGKARVVVVDDHDIARLGLVMILGQIPDLQVVAQASDATGALAAVREHEPDLVLLDVRMPDAEGFDAARQIRAISPDVRVIMVSSWDSVAYVQEALLAGASGYLSKSARCEAIANEIRRVLRGEPLQPSQAAHQILEEVSRSVPPNAHLLVKRLTQRQREVLSLSAAGLTNKKVGERLGISEHTARTLAEQVRRRLGVSNKTQAAMYWVAAALQGPWAPRADSA